MRRCLEACLVVALAGWLGAVSLLPAQEKSPGDWPVFRGDSLQTGVAVSPLPDALAVLWTFNAPDGIEGTPAIVGQTVYVGAMDGTLYALDLASGKKQWQYRAEGGIKAAPAVRAGAVYVGDLAGQFHCVEAATGKKRWSVPTKGPILSPANFFQDKIVFGSDDHHIYWVTPAGKVAGQVKTGGQVHGAPAVVGDRILVGGCDKSLHVVDPIAGKRVTVLDLEGHVGASVAVRGDHLYVGSMENRFLAVDWKKGAILWSYQPQRGAQPFYASAAVTEDLVVVASRDRCVRALQRQTGKEIWTFATRGRVDSSPVIVGQRVVAASLDGHLYVLDLTRGTELARFDLGAMAGSPAVGGGRLVVGTVRGASSPATRHPSPATRHERIFFRADWADLHGSGWRLKASRAGMADWAAGPRLPRASAADLRTSY